MAGSRRVLRLMLVTCWLQFKMIGPDTFTGVLNVLCPLFDAGG